MEDNVDDQCKNFDISSSLKAAFLSGKCSVILRIIFKILSENGDFSSNLAAQKNTSPLLYYFSKSINAIGLKFRAEFNDGCSDTISDIYVLQGTFNRMEEYI